MTEHEIRLRAAWEGRFPGPAGEGVRRVDLPAPWPPGPEAPFRLRRAFQSPRYDPGHEAVRLRLADVPGLTAAWLNGVALIGPDAAADRGTREIPLPGPLPRRNLLELAVDPACWGEGAAPEGGPWGRIALVIGPRTGDDFVVGPEGTGL